MEHREFLPKKKINPSVSMQLINHTRLATGQFASYETLSSWAYLFVAGLGDAEHTITVSLLNTMVSNIII